MICKNCGMEADGKFCSNCGQKTEFYRYTVKHILHDFFHTFTHVDKGILFLIKEQFLRPGIVVREYLEGKRTKYFNPFQYLLLGIAVVTFFTVNLDLGTGMFADVTTSGSNVKAAEEIIHNFTHFLYKYFNLIMIGTLPLMAMYSRLIFRKAGYNYAEHLILNTFVSGQRHLLYLFIVPLLYFFREQSSVIIRIFATVWTIYFVITYLQFFQVRKKVWGVIKALMVSFLFLITNAAILGIIFFVFFYKTAA